MTTNVITTKKKYLPSIRKAGIERSEND